jgi:hypothetical protein
METEVMTLPIEVSELAVKVSATKQDEVRAVLNQIFAGTADWGRQVDLIEVKGISDTMSIQLAETARKNVKTARLNAEKVFDAKRAEVQQMKSEYDLEDKLWLKAKQVMQITFKAIEEKAEWKANIIARHEAEQKELRTQKRIAEVALYQEPGSEFNRSQFENMDEETFDFFLNGIKETRKRKLWEAEQEEQQRIERQNAIQEEIERNRVENERLKAEAIKKEKEMEAERQAANAKLRAEQQARQAAEAILKAKAQAEEKERQDKMAAENAARKQAIKSAQAPVKKQLTDWISSSKLPELNIEHHTKQLIDKKFDAFKNWALAEINKIN